MNSYRFYLLCALFFAGSFSNAKEISVPTLSKEKVKIINPFDGHLDISLVDVAMSSKRDITLKLQINKQHEINAPDSLGRGDSRNEATAHKLCYTTWSVDLKVIDADKKIMLSGSVEIPDLGSPALIREIALKGLDSYKTPIQIKFDCTPYIAD